MLFSVSLMGGLNLLLEHMKKTEWCMFDEVEAENYVKQYLSWHKSQCRDKYRESINIQV